LHQRQQASFGRCEQPLDIEFRRTRAFVDGTDLRADVPGANLDAQLPRFIPTVQGGATATLPIQANHQQRAAGPNGHR
jgi:hypothetical protein